MAARPRRRVRYEEYAAHGPAPEINDDDDDDDQRGHDLERPSRDKPSRSRAVSGDAKAPHVETPPPPPHAASASHRANDAYMEVFDAAYEDMVQRHGGMTLQDAKPAKREPARPLKPSTGSKEHSTRDGEEATPGASRTQTDALRGGWVTGPASPEGTVHAVSAQPVMCMSLSADEREAVVGSSDHALYAIPLGTTSAHVPRSGTGRAASTGVAGGRMRTLYTKKFGHTEWVTCSTYLSDNRIVSGGMDSKLCLWDATGVKCEDLTGHAGSITLVRRLGNDDLLLSASYDKTVRVWNVSRKASSRQREVSSIKAGTAPILDASVFAGTATPRSVITGDRDGCVHVVDLDGEKVTRKISGAHKGHTTSVLASRWDDSTLCFSGGQDGSVRVWDLRQKSSTPAHALELHVDRKSGKAGAVGFLLEPHDDRNILLTGGADGTVKVLDKRQAFKTLFNFMEHLDYIYSLHVRDQLCFSGAGNGMLHVHDWKQGRLLYGLGANKAAVRAIETTATRLIAAGDDGGVIVYDMN